MSYSLGVAHGDDSYFVIASPAKNPTTTVEDRSMQRELLDFWISFATCGCVKYYFYF